MGAELKVLAGLPADWRYKQPLIWTASALGVVAALGAGTLLLKPLLAKALRDRISRKRANIEEASQAARPPESSLLKVLSHSSTTGHAYSNQA